ncbi:MAG: hypothetical protein K2L74_01655 [Muribaculaceae bacterium]|nr:hypothetical protein [Muribaculaceae bacterium]
MHQALFNSHYNLTAGEADAHSLMPVTLLVERVIEIATRHANCLDVGYDDLKTAGIGWVFSRMSALIERYPRINEEYALNTWIESYNRHFCERCFDMVDAAGSLLASVRCTFVAIDMKNRTMADLASFEREAIPTLDRPCAVRPAPRMRRLPKDCEQRALHFGYCDIDFNRHVNTVRYIERVLDHWPLAHHDRNAVRRIDIAFSHELLYGEEATLRVAPADGADGSAHECEIIAPDGTRAATMRIAWQRRRDMEP